MKKLFIFIAICGVIAIVISFFKLNENKIYNEESAIKELEYLFTEISSGNSPPLNSSLIEYIYISQQQFPTVKSTSTDNDKLKILMPVYMQLNAILSNQMMKNPGYFNKHHAKLFSALGTLSSRVMPVCISFMESFDKNDPSYLVRKDGLKTAFNGTKKFLIGYLIALFVEVENQEIEKILLNNLKSFGPVLIHNLPNEYKESTKAYLKTFEPNVKPYLKKEYDSIISNF